MFIPSVKSKPVLVRARTEGHSSVSTSSVNKLRKPPIASYKGSASVQTLVGASADGSPLVSVSTSSSNQGSKVRNSMAQNKGLPNKRVEPSNPRKRAFESSQPASKKVFYSVVYNVCTQRN